MAIDHKELRMTMCNMTGFEIPTYLRLNQLAAADFTNILGESFEELYVRDGPRLNSLVADERMALRNAGLAYTVEFLGQAYGPQLGHAWLITEESVEVNLLQQRRQFYDIIDHIEHDVEVFTRMMEKIERKAETIDVQNLSEEQEEKYFRRSIADAVVQEYTHAHTFAEAFVRVHKASYRTSLAASGEPMAELYMRVLDKSLEQGFTQKFVDFYSSHLILPAMTRN